MQAKPNRISHAFGAAATWVARASGRPGAFAIAAASIIAWGLSGPIFGFSDTWQLLVNTSTTIITFLMVFLIQHTQNRDNEALHIKIDELIRAAKNANNAMIDLEELEEEQLDRVRATYTRLARAARAGKQAGKESPEVIESTIGDPTVEPQR
jgi:low affinity Fe/Cu permease